MSTPLQVQQLIIHLPVSSDESNAKLAQNALSIGKPTLRQLRDIQDVICMSQHTLENTLRPYASYDEDGINLLPDEVLAMVLEQVHESAKGGIDFCAEEFSSQHKHTFVAAHVPVRLSHVSRRFRKVALNCQTLWTSVLSNYKAKMLKVFLNWSGRNTGLTIQLGEDSYGRQWRQLYAFVHRRENIILYESFSPKNAENMWPFSEPLILPRLYSLSLVICKYPVISLANEIRLPWNTPNLRLLTVINSTTFLPANGGFNILTLNLALPAILDAQLILTRLRQMPNLEQLSLSLNCHMLYDVGPGGAYDTVELPYLTSLTIELRRDYRFAVLIPRIIAPNVRKMNIVLNYSTFYDEFDLNDCNSALLLDSKGRMPMLQEIGYALTLGDTERPIRRPNDILRFLTDWEKLEHVSLENPYGFDDLIDAQFPVVRTLTLNRCHRSINRHLENILKRSSDVYMESNGSCGLKCLQIIKCANIDMVKVQKFVPADRITVHL